MNPDWGLLNRLRPRIQLLVELIGPIDKCPALIIKDRDPRALGVALLLPFGEGTVALVYLTLLSLSQLLLRRNAHLGLVNFSFERLVVGAAGLDVVLKVTAILVLSRYFDSNSLGLLGNLNSLSLLVTVLGPENFKLVVQTGDDILLTTQLCLVVSLKSGATDIKGFFTFTKLLNLGLEWDEVSFTMLVRLDFRSIRTNDSITDASAQLTNFERLLVLVLDLCILNMLTLFPLLSMLFVKAERLGIGYNFFSFLLSLLLLFISGWRVGCLTKWWTWVHSGSTILVRASLSIWFSCAIMSISHIVFSIGILVCCDLSFPLLSIVRHPKALTCRRGLILSSGRAASCISGRSHWLIVGASVAIVKVTTSSTIIGLFRNVFLFGIWSAWLLNFELSFDIIVTVIFFVIIVVKLPGVLMLPSKVGILGGIEPVSYDLIYLFVGFNFFNVLEQDCDDLALFKVTFHIVSDVDRWGYLLLTGVLLYFFCCHFSLFKLVYLSVSIF